MEGLIGFLCLLPGALLGYCAVRLWLGSGSANPAWNTLFQAALGAGLGAGFTGCLYFMLLLVGVSGLPVTVGVQLLLAGALIALVVRQRSQVATSTPEPATGAFPLWLPALAMAGMLAIFVMGFAGISDSSPQGGWDAFAIWNLRARFLIHPATWKYATAPASGTHMEYPLLLSSLIAQGWVWTGAPVASVPIATAFLFALALAGVLVGAISIARGAALGLLAGVVLLANPSLLAWSVAQYADVPLAFFFTAALALIVLAPSAPRPERYLSLAGVSVSFGAFTKNEGLLLLAALALAVLISNRRSAARNLLAFLAGALPVLLLLFAFKFAMAPPDPMTTQLASRLGQLVNPARWSQIIGGFLRLGWDLYVIPGPAVLVLAAIGGLLRLRPKAERNYAPAIAVLAVLAGYFAIFLLTRDDVAWLLDTALDRLYLHLWPALVLSVFLLVRRPEDFAIVSTIKSKKAR